MKRRGKARLSAILAVVLAAGFSVGIHATGAPPGQAVPTEKNKGKKLIAAGIPFGIRFHTDGVIVVGICGNSGAAADAGLHRGDVITEVNGMPVRSVAELLETVKNSGGKPLLLTYQSGEESRTAEVTPTPDESGEWKLGIWIKDSAAGIGTVTFIDPDTLAFAGLGHGICDTESGALVPFSYGSAEEVTLSGIMAGRTGAPGELKGSFSGRKTGKLLENAKSGIYGVFYELPTALKGEVYPIAGRGEAKEGEAFLITTVDGDGRKQYTIELAALDGSGGGRNFTVHVTDEALIAKTGGIVQGMSGSPIIQNGKIIGAVTHVLVSDPTQGYGILIENMLSGAADAAMSSLRSAA